LTGEFFLQEILEPLEAEIILPSSRKELKFEGVCASDLMSDVLAFSKSKYLLLTSLVNLQTIRTAEITELDAICFVHGKKPAPEVVTLAKEHNILLLSTKLSMYEACGSLYGLLELKKQQ
jgi:hypothetical protein